MIIAVLVEVVLVEVVIVVVVAVVVVIVKNRPGVVQPCFGLREIVKSMTMAAANDNTCKHWLKGKCRFGGVCRFSHGDTAQQEGNHGTSGVESTHESSGESAGLDATQQKGKPAIGRGWPKLARRLWVHLFLYPPIGFGYDMVLG